MFNRCDAYSRGVGFKVFDQVSAKKHTAPGNSCELPGAFSFPREGVQDGLGNRIRERCVVSPIRRAGFWNLLLI